MIKTVMPYTSDTSIVKQGDFTEVKVLGVYVHPTRNTPIVFVGTEAESVIIPIWIGFLEAQAILFAWKGLVPPRPLTLDLMYACITQDLGASITMVEIYDLSGGTYYARVSLATATGEQRLRDARPSDAIALALRAGTKLYVGAHIIEACKPEFEETKALFDFLKLESEDIRVV